MKAELLNTNLETQQILFSKFHEYLYTGFFLIYREQNLFFFNSATKTVDYLKS